MAARDGTGVLRHRHSAVRPSSVRRRGGSDEALGAAPTPAPLHRPPAGSPVRDATVSSPGHPVARSNREEAQGRVARSGRRERVPPRAAKVDGGKRPRSAGRRRRLWQSQFGLLRGAAQSHGEEHPASHSVDRRAQPETSDGTARRARGPESPGLGDESPEPPGRGRRTASIGADAAVFPLAADLAVGRCRDVLFAPVRLPPSDPPSRRRFAVVRSGSRRDLRRDDAANDVPLRAEKRAAAHAWSCRRRRPPPPAPAAARPPAAPAEAASEADTAAAAADGGSPRRCLAAAPVPAPGRAGAGAASSELNDGLNGQRIRASPASPAKTSTVASAPSSTSTARSAGTT